MSAKKRFSFARLFLIGIYIAVAATISLRLYYDHHGMKSSNPIPIQITFSTCLLFSVLYIYAILSALFQLGEKR